MAIVGEAFVLVRPDTTPFMPELQAKMAAAEAETAAAAPPVPVAGAGGAGGLGAVEAETAGAATAIEADTARAGKALESVGPSAEKAAGSGGKAFTGLAKLIGGQASEMTGATNLIEENLSKVDKAGLNATSSIEGLGSAALPVMAAVAAAVAVTAGSALKFEEWGETVHRLSLLMGSGAEQASRLAYAFELAGVSGDKVAVAMGRFSRNLESGHVDLQRYGLEVSKNADGTINLNESFLNLADAMQRLGPGAEANTLALQTLGRGGAALIPILVQGRQALQDLMSQTPSNLILSDADAKRAHDFSIQLRQVKIDAEALFVTIGKDVVPTLITMASVLDEVVRHGSGFLGFLYKASTLIASGPFAPVTIAIDKLRGGHSSLNSELDKTVKSLQDQADAADASALADERATQATKALTDQMNLVGQSAAAVIDDQRNLEQSHRSRIAAETELTRAQEDLDKIQKAGGVDIDKLTAATDRARSAQESLTRAQHEGSDAAQSVHEKTLALAEAVALYGTDSEEARKARTDLDDANFRASQAAQSARDSQRDLGRAHDDMAKAAVGGTDALRKLQDAQQRVADAKAAVEDAVYGEARAAAQLKTDMDGAAGKTDTASEKTQNLITGLQGVAGTLAPNSPIRANLEAYIASLQRALSAETDLAEQANGFAADQANKSANFATGEGNPGPPHGIAAPPGTAPYGIAAPPKTGNTINIFGVQDPAQITSTLDGFFSGNWLPSGLG